MIRTFINRKEELSFLERKYKEGNFQFIVLYGRRRTGKTELISHFLKDKDSIYYLADKRGTLINAKLFAKEAAKKYDDIEPAVDNFDLTFEYILKRAGNKKIIVAIDEFSYLLEKDDSLASVFQKISDMLLKNSNVFLILCGSSISMMEKGVLSYKSPLYGRRTGHWKLVPLHFIESVKFFPKYSIEDQIKTYLILGGIPAYMKEFNAEKGLYENIKDKILTKGEMLYDEVKVILQEELREPSTYLKILDNMAKGSTKIVDIANKSYLDAKDIPKYLNILQKLEYVKRINPITEKKPKSKKTLYKISDNFFQFWLNFIEPNRSELELNKRDVILEQIKKESDMLFGRSFEKLCAELMLELPLPITPSKIGTWWGRGKALSTENLAREEIEIDIVAIDEHRNEILSVECKWSNLSEKEARQIIIDLKEKTKFIELKRKKDHLGIFAKNVQGKENLKKEGIIVFDLDDIKKIKA